MMNVNAIQSNDRRRSCFLPMAEGAALGTVAGYATKYILPLTPEEKSTDEYIKVKNKINTQKSEYNFRTAKFLDTYSTYRYYKDTPLLNYRLSLSFLFQVLH